MDAVNHQFRLAARPVGLPKPSDWTYAEEPVREPGDGEVLVKIAYISLDPAMRGWMNEGRSYIPPVGIGEVMRAFAAGEVIASNDPDVAVGEHVGGLLGVQEYAIANGKGVFKVDTSLAPLPVYLGTLGMPGVTAYFGLLDIGRPRQGDTVVVSGAAGAVGGLVGQIAKLKGCRVVGIAGRAREVPPPARGPRLRRGDRLQGRKMSTRRLASTAPRASDIYFDNVGGEILDAALAHLARNARVVICGAISQYNSTSAAARSVQLPLAARQPREHDRLHDGRLPRRATARRCRRWPAGSHPASSSRARTSREGLENFPQVLLRLFHGENTGKLVLEV